MCIYGQHSSAIYKHGCKSHSTRVTSLTYQRQVGIMGAAHFSGGDRSYTGHSYLPNKLKRVANSNLNKSCGTHSKDGNIFLSAYSQGILTTNLV